MAAEVIKIPYDAREPFKAFHARRQRLAILVYHRRAGKTVGTVNDLVDKALHCTQENGSYAYIAPYMGQAVQTAWKYLIKAVQGIPGRKINNTLKLVEIPSAHGTFATIRLFGADNPESLRGLYFDGIVLDEVADMKKGVWTEVLKPTLMDRHGWVVFIGTPKGKNFFYDLWERAKKNPSKWFSQMLKASESGFLTQQELDDYKDEVDEETYQQEMECSFSAGIKGTFYADLINKMEANGQLAPLEVVRAAPVHTAWDLGISDATSVWFYQLVNNTIHVIHHQEWTDVGIHEILDEVEALGFKTGDVWLPHDARTRSLQTGKSLIEQFVKRGYAPKIVPELRIRDGINAVKLTLPKMLIDGEACYQGIQSLKNYKRAWSDKHQTYSVTPDHDWASHSADSMRYLCLAIKERDIEKPIQVQKRTDLPIQAPTAHPAINTSINTGYTLMLAPM